MKSALTVCASLAFFIASVIATPCPADDCNDVTKFLYATGGSNPPYLRWNTPIPFGCSNCGEVENNIISECRGLWGEVSGGEFTVGTVASVSWKFTTWTGGHNLMQTTPTGSPYLTSTFTELDGTRVDWWINETSTDGMGNNYDFYTAILHELGHALGLKHANCGEAVMNDTLDPGDHQRFLGCPDMAAVRVAYDVQDKLVTNSACEDNPVAEVVDFRYAEGVVSFTVVHEWNTQEYLIEGCDLPRGEGFTLAVDKPFVGTHTIAIVADGFKWLRLTEVETSGKRLHKAICGTKVSSPGAFDAAAAAIVAARKAEIAEAARQSTAQSVRREVVIEDPTCVVYAMPWLVSIVESDFADYWNTHGHIVEVVSMPYITDGGVMSSWLKGSIASYAEDGVKYFHLVGDWTDDFMSPLWHSSAYWQSKFDAYFAQGLIPALPPDNIFRIPTFLIPDAEHEAENTAAKWPYIYSDRPYADTDDDGVPDVIVTRWPFTNETDVAVACENMQTYAETHELPGGGPRRVSFFVSDVGGEGIVTPGEMVDDLVDVLNTTLAQPIVGSVHELDYPEYAARNVAARNHLNTQKPDVLALLGVNSIYRAPGFFFFRQTSPSDWDMSQISSGWFVRAVIAASCEGGKWVPWGSSFHDFVVSEDFLTTPDRGTVAWIGPTTGSRQGANYLVERFILEELYANPYRPMAESWLVAMRRAYEHCEAYPEYIPTLDAYVFLGNPLSPFSRVPSATITATAQPVAACPAGDAGIDLVVTVNLEDDIMTRTVQPWELTLDIADLTAKVFEADNVLSASGAASAANGYTTTIQHRAFGSCSPGEPVNVLLNGSPLSSAPTVTIRSWDLAPPYGSYTIVDFSTFGSGYPADPAVNDCRDYNGDNKVTLLDFNWFSSHHNHSSPYAPANAPSMPFVQSNAGVVLRFTEEFPTATTHRLYVDVDMQAISGVTASLFGVTADNERLSFVEWRPAQQSLGTVMCSPIVREDKRYVYVGVMVSEMFVGSDSPLGQLVFDVTGTAPFEIAEDDFVLSYGEVLLELGGGTPVAAQMEGVLVRVLDPSFERVYHTRLEHNFPNPFNPTTTLAFSIKDAGNVSLTIYDVAGRRVRELVNERRERGAYKVVWDGLNDAGQTVASGVYFYKMVAGSFTDTKKMIMLK